MFFAVPYLHSVLEFSKYFFSSCLCLLQEKSCFHNIYYFPWISFPILTKLCKLENVTFYSNCLQVHSLNQPSNIMPNERMLGKFYFIHLILAVLPDFSVALYTLFFVENYRLIEIWHGMLFCRHWECGPIFIFKIKLTLLCPIDTYKHI